MNQTTRRGERAVVEVPDHDGDHGVGALLLELGEDSRLYVCYRVAHEGRRGEERVGRPRDLGGVRRLSVRGLYGGTSTYVRDVHCIWQLAHRRRTCSSITLRLPDLIYVAEEWELRRERQGW